MGKTYKRLCMGYHRRPRGAKQAKILGFRRKAIPPTSWDDINACNLAYRPYRVAEKLFNAGAGREAAVQKLQKRFRLTRREALDATYLWERRTALDYAQDAYRGLPVRYQVFVRLVYGDDLVRWHRDALSGRFGGLL